MKKYFNKKCHMKHMKPYEKNLRNTRPQKTIWNQAASHHSKANGHNQAEDWKFPMLVLGGSIGVGES